MVTVHVVPAFDARLDDKHVKPVTVIGATSEIVNVCAPAPSVAVWLVSSDPAVAVNVAVDEPPATVTDAGTASTLAIPPVIVTVDPPVGAAWFIVTVHVVPAFDARLDDKHVRPVTVIGATSDIVNVWAPAPSVAVWLVSSDPAVAVKVAVEAPPATVTDAGTVSTLAMPPVIVTVDPPAGAAWFIVTVHVVPAFDARLDDKHVSPVTVIGATSDIVNVCAPAPSVAVWLVNSDPAVAVNVAVDEPPATVIDAGTVSTLAIPPVIVTVEPPVGAAWFIVTVHVVPAFDARLDDKHVRPVTVIGATSDIVNVWAPAPSVAVWLVNSDPAVAVKVAVEDPPATVTDAGTVSTLAMP